MNLRTMRRTRQRRETVEMRRRSMLRDWARDVDRVMPSTLFRPLPVTTEILPPATWSARGGIFWVWKPQPYIQLSPEAFQR